MENQGNWVTERSVEKILDSTLRAARDCEATHIHIEPFESTFRVRLRIGGSFEEHSSHPRELLSPLVQHVKNLSGMDAAETRLPQSGVLHQNYSEGSVKFWVESTPGIAGERLCMHNRFSSLLSRDLSQLGMDEHPLDAYRQGTLLATSGLVILNGPTGSGKNSTSYATLRALAKQGRSLATAEWSEWGELIPGVNHVVVNHEIGVTFASCIRQFRRSDLDAAYIREMLDFETAEQVIRAVVENNMLVLVCMNVKDSVSTLFRLKNMGIEPWLVSASVTLAQAQRVLRKLCPDCKLEAKIPAKVLIEAGCPPDEAENLRAFRPGGCSFCRHSGYRGTLMVAESMPFTASLQESFLSGRSEDELDHLATKLGFERLRRSALNRLREGQTSLDEVLLRTPASP